MSRESRRKARGRNAGDAPEFRTPPKTEVILRKDSPWGGMSDKLAFIARPWIERLGPAPEQPAVAFVYEVVSLIWNASRLPAPADAATALDEVRGLMERALPDLPSTDVQDLIDEIFGLAREHHPEDPRLIAKTMVEDRGDGHFHLRVASMQCR